LRDDKGRNSKQIVLLSGIEPLIDMLILGGIEPQPKEYEVNVKKLYIATGTGIEPGPVKLRTRV